MKLELILSMLLFSGLASCQPSGTKQNEEKNKENTTEEVSALHADKTFVLPKQLNEISGISFLANDTEHIYAVQDESGIVYSYHLTSEKIVSEYEFAPAGDYEEITNDGSYFYVLRSDGTIFSFPVDLKAAQAKVNVFEGQLGKGEYESMSYDSDKKELYVLCKSCSQDKGKASVSGYTVQVQADGILTLGAPFEINLDAVNQLGGKALKSLKPSAIVKRSATKDWYVLSSVDKLLLILDASLKPKKLIRFDKKQFEQPEGITFDQSDRMFISSEKNKGDNALLFQYTKQP
ncbi:SdiA-regulated family protein [Sphingobacterium sp. DK4209]|uniref:SdiA-regulated family protein n=1 Tax=Sphingobacterium zhuxiongii TaxID=2662364 RepID=A0A5Q0QCH5_9SPHI|nr:MULTISPECIES: SdiA-regulated domain-containing protein [unclassified Sphingobacterium]MVZ66196.1 SdiA-regulated family protein [Sphingobacterium sp. DK4209]QGA24920.1 SdiA-regulated family protein [Sphingobacterium sp. dk4302]